MPPHPLTNFEIQKCYHNEHKFNGVYSRNNSAKIKDGAYEISLDEFYSTRTLWKGLHVNNNKNESIFTALELNILSKKFKKLF